MADLQTEQATVYRMGGGRRYLTKRAAVKAFARSAVLQRYPCSCEPEVEYVCDTCALRCDYREILIDRYFRLLWRGLKGTGTS